MAYSCPKLREQSSEALYVNGVMVDIRPTSFAPFYRMESLWCSWSAIVPEDGEFDLSTALPAALKWLMLYCVPVDELGILKRALCKLTHLQRIWIQVQYFSCDGECLPDVAIETYHTNLMVEEATRCGLLWSGPEDNPVLKDYLPYLEVHGSEMNS